MNCFNGEKELLQVQEDLSCSSDERPWDEAGLASAPPVRCAAPKPVERQRQKTATNWALVCVEPPRWMLCSPLFKSCLLYSPTILWIGNSRIHIPGSASLPRSRATSQSPCNTSSPEGPSMAAQPWLLQHQVSLNSSILYFVVNIDLAQRMVSDYTCHYTSSTSI